MEERSVIFDALFPRFCVSCEEEGALLCLRCAGEVRIDGTPMAYANPVVRKLMCSWKYSGDSEGLAQLIRLVRPRTDSLEVVVKAHRIEAIVPVPLSSWKERMRGFNQARDGARAMGELLRLPVTEVLLRKQKSGAQANLSHEARKVSFVKSPFSLRKNAEMPRRVLLFDDVETTGATMDAAEMVLRDGGVEDVVRWSFARG